MSEILNTRDLVILHQIASWNSGEAKRVKDYPVEARPSLSKPCTITTLCGKHEVGGGLVNHFIATHKMAIEKPDDSEQVYRSIRKLVKAGLVMSTERTGRQQYSQTRTGSHVVASLNEYGNPQYWPSQVEVDGPNIKIRPSMLAK